MNPTTHMPLNLMGFDWPEVFITGKIPPAEVNDERLLAGHIIHGWGLCYLEKPPENFGKGMVALGLNLKIIPTEIDAVNYSRKKGYIT